MVTPGFWLQKKCAYKLFALICIQAHTQIYIYIYNCIYSYIWYIYINNYIYIYINYIYTFKKKWEHCCVEWLDCHWISKVILKEHAYVPNAHHYQEESIWKLWEFKGRKAPNEVYRLQFQFEEFVLDCSTQAARRRRCQSFHACSRGSQEWSKAWVVPLLEGSQLFYALQEHHEVLKYLKSNILKSHHCARLDAQLHRQLHRIALQNSWLLRKSWPYNPV